MKPPDEIDTVPSRFHEFEERAEPPAPQTNTGGMRWLWWCIAVAALVAVAVWLRR